ncbi:MAG TPA: DedA family protein [Stellaceae bacterium]|nr:DedA family protein [Stellaceae bacterium]
MLEHLIALLAGFVIATISGLGYLGILLLMAIESACIPLPSEVIMPFAGYLAYVGRFDLGLVATAGALGCNLGSAAAYAVGYFGGRPLVERWGRYVLMTRHDLDLVDRFFARYGGFTVFVCRLLPVVRTFIALPAGIARMPQARFHLYTFFGSWPWCYALAYIGFRLGERWNTDPALRQAFHDLHAVIIGALALLLAWYVRRHWKHRLPLPEKAVAKTGKRP